MAKKPKINTLVTMYVNTEFPGLSQDNIEDHVWMGDSNGDVANNNAGKVKDYFTVYQDGKDPLELYIDPKITVNR